MSEPFTALLEAFLPAEWQLTAITPRITRADAPDQASVAIKTYPMPASAEREFAVLSALRDFGMNLAPEPLHLAGQQVIMSWLNAQPIRYLPDLHDQEGWQRMMSALGASDALQLGRYSKTVPMQGRGYMRPGDLIDDLGRKLSQLDSNNPIYGRLAQVLERVRQQVAPDWHTPAPVGLQRCDPATHNLLWDGHHLLAVDWERADWGDLAAEIGLWSAHPDYEQIPSPHWVWVRWEVARLKHEQELVPRATIYARLGLVYWALELATSADTALRDRYIQRAEKAFPG